MTYSIYLRDGTLEIRESKGDFAKVVRIFVDKIYDQIYSRVNI
jgi:hypothetical protein